MSTLLRRVKSEGLLRKRVRSVADAVPIVLALALCSGVIASFVRLPLVEHPAMGWSEVLVADAKALASGYFIYADPSRHYVGAHYSPLFTFVHAGLMRLYWWEGWGALISMTCVGVAVFALARTLSRGARLSRNALAQMATLVAFTLSSFTLIGVNGVFEARADQMAWALFVIAAVRILDDLSALEPRSLKRRALTGVILALSILTKQTTLPSCLAAAGIAGCVGFFSARQRASAAPTWKEQWLELSALVLVVALALGILQLVSGGYAFDLLIELPQRHFRLLELDQGLEIAARALLVPSSIALLVLAAHAAAWVLRRRSAPATPLFGEPRKLLLVSAAFALLLATLSGGVLAITKQGASANQLIGCVWALALVLVAIFLGSETAERRWTAYVIAGVLVLCSIGPLADLAADHDIATPGFVLDKAWQELPAELVKANEKGKNVFDWEYPSLSFVEGSAKPPGLVTFCDMAAGGYSPRWFIRNILRGEYDMVR
ncbi:MAG TPA: hypothetical protein VK524_26415, partial [Polyangiaceae bacterium]|nr:hypothetical protein [Polyangiaceae bacterium]